jgi:hypothetical protein
VPGQQQTEVQMCDPVWQSTHDALADLNGRLMKAIVQSPVEHRHAAIAATAMASRPGDVGLDADAAAQFFRRMY